MKLYNYSIEDQRKFTHESAHAVMALKMNIETEFVRVSISSEKQHIENRRLGVSSDSQIISEPYAWKRYPFSEHEDCFESNFNLTICALSGYGAENIYLGDGFNIPTNSSDFKDSQVYINKCAEYSESDIIKEFKGLKPEHHKAVISSMLFKSAREKCIAIIESTSFKNSVFSLAEVLTEEIEVSGIRIKQLLL